MILVIILLIANIYLLLQLGKPVVTSNVKEKWIVLRPWVVDGLVNSLII